MQLGVGLGLNSRPTVGKLRVAGGGFVGRTQAQTVRTFSCWDIDPQHERDDESDFSLRLATQEWFEDVGKVADAPDGNAAQILAMVNAYHKDRYYLLANTPYPERFKTKAQLDAITYQGATSDAPAAGYRVSGDAQYAESHAASQALIAAAQAYGSAHPVAGPRDKLWVLVGGGWVTVAQAAYEAVQLGQLPDFFKRCRFVGQPNYNSWIAPNSWNYLFGNCWPTAVDPGMFGDWWAVLGYFKFHAFNRDNGGTDRTFWTNKIITRGAMGALLEAERAVSDFTVGYFRAGDAGIWDWLISALVLDNFDPTNAANWGGVYQTYIGTNPWPSRTFGYGGAISPGTPNPEGVTFSPTLFAPPLTVNNNTAAAQNSVNLTKWYEIVGETFERYALQPPLTTNTLLKPGTLQTVFRVTGPETLLEGVEGDFQLEWIGAAIVDPITVTLSEVNGGDMTVTLAAALAAVSATGVSAAGNTLTIGPTATSPVVIKRTPTDDGLIEFEDYILSITAVSAGGVFADSPVITTIIDAATDPTPYLIFEQRLNAGAGNVTQVVADSSGNGLDGFKGTSSVGTTSDPDWVAAGLDYIGTTDGVMVPHNVLFDRDSFVLVWAGTHDAVTLNRQMMVLWDSSGAPPVFAMRSALTEFQFLGRGASPVTVATVGLGLTVGVPRLFVAKVDGVNVKLRVNGVQVATGVLNNPVPTSSTNRFAIGARLNTSFVEGFDGRVHYDAFYQQVDDSLLEAIEQKAVAAIFADHGITITLPP